MRRRLVTLTILSLLAGGCQNDRVDVTYQSFKCPEVPGLDEFLEAAYANNDNMLNSDEFNAPFQEAMDDVTPDRQLDRNELARYACAEQKAMAAAQPQ